LGVESHLVPADLSGADRQLEAAIPAEGQLARLLLPNQQLDLAEIPSVAVALPIAALELDVEPLGRTCTAQLLDQRLDAVDGVLRHDAFHIRCKERYDLPEVAGVEGNFDSRLELLGRF